MDRERRHGNLTHFLCSTAMFKTLANLNLPLLQYQPVFQYQQDASSDTSILSRASFASNSDASFTAYEFPTRQEHWSDHFGGRLAPDTQCISRHGALLDYPKWCLQPGGTEVAGQPTFILSSESDSPGRLGRGELENLFHLEYYNLLGHRPDSSFHI